ncbi:HHL241Wp [Eremothecium sinecaudum]|uniref:HHL241Wp n=1 Tax=Eremothecium sinecaudum TaxID=45286 RepID=A0A0X8HVY9_9SACH|nr:HHL241Wp [Eremothecium sinecaudum]AMD22529.1 HHL241Wp [Eremothecium sinecaudum]
MNKNQKDKFKERHISHKYNTLHTIPRVGIPQISGLYLKSFYNALKRNRIALPTSILENDRKFCSSCGCIQICGYNLEAKVVESKTAGSITRNLAYKCLNCNKVKLFELSSQEDTTSVEKSPFIAKWPKTPSENKTKGAVTKKTAKDRAKMRKNTLSNMLASKKQETASKNKVTLSLSDFLQK